MQAMPRSMLEKKRAVIELLHEELLAARASAMPPAMRRTSTFVTKSHSAHLRRPKTVTGMVGPEATARDTITQGVSAQHVAASVPASVEPVLRQIIRQRALA